MRFESVANGTTKRETVKLQFGSREYTVDFSLLSVGKEAEAVERARAYANSRGIENPADDDPMFRMGLHAAVLALSLVDTESPKEAPIPFFASPDVIHNDSTITLDEIEFAFARYNLFADANSVRKAAINDEEFLAIVSASAGGDLLPFFGLRLGTQAAFLRSLAAQFLTSLRNRSVSISPS